MVRPEAPRKPVAGLQTEPANYKGFWRTTGTLGIGEIRFYQDLLTRDHRAVVADRHGEKV